MAARHDHLDGHRAPRRSPVTIELRPVAPTAPTEDLRRRERELERLIVTAACRRAARLAAEACSSRPADGRAAAVGE
jgi:hypothetical protein